MRGIVVTVALAGCGFTLTASPGEIPDDAQIDSQLTIDAAVDVPIDAAIDASQPCWPYTPTNFMCALAAPVPLLVTSARTLDTDAPDLPSSLITQPDGSTMLLVHLSSLTVGSTFTVQGSRPVTFAVDGDVMISGSIRSTAGANHAIQCVARTGTGGTASNSTSIGGGGGGGGGGGAMGGNGTDGGDGATGRGVGGPGGAPYPNATELSPLHGGCAGGGGETSGGAGTPGAGGRGGGAVQVTAQGTITVGGVIDVTGVGGGGTTMRTGGGGGGSGGGILLEAASVSILGSAVLCADGGAGGEGGGNPNPGAAGGGALCTGIAGATTASFNTFGGAGGDGGFRGQPSGANAGPTSQTLGGGGGGGGGVGSIRVRSVAVPPSIAGTAIVTPAPRTN